MEKKSLSAPAEPPAAPPKDAVETPAAQAAPQPAAAPVDNTIRVEGILDFDVT